MLQYSTTQKLRKGLMDLKVNGEPVIMISKINNKDMLVVNPKIYYKGEFLEPEVYYKKIREEDAE